MVCACEGVDRAYIGPNVAHGVSPRENFARPT